MNNIDIEVAKLTKLNQFVNEHRESLSENLESVIAIIEEAYHAGFEEGFSIGFTIGYKEPAKEDDE